MVRIRRTAAHPHQEFLGVPPPPPRALGIHNTETERAERSSKKIRSVEDDKRARNDLSKTSSKQDLGESIRKLVMFLFVPKNSATLNLKKPARWTDINFEKVFAYRVVPDLATRLDYRDSNDRSEGRA